MNKVTSNVAWNGKCIPLTHRYANAKLIHFGKSGESHIIQFALQLEKERTRKKQQKKRRHFWSQASWLHCGKCGSKNIPRIFFFIWIYEIAWVCALI